MKSFTKFVEIFENYSSDEANPKAMKAHRRNISMGIGGTRTLLPTRFQNLAVDRILISKIISLFYHLLTLQSEEFNSQIIESNILKCIVELCEMYDDHTLIQNKIRMVFEVILKMEDINIKTKLLNESRCIFVFAK